MRKYKLDLKWFGEEGAAAPVSADGGGSAQTAVGEGTMPIQAGDTLPDGTMVQSQRVAAAMEKQMQRHPELRAKYVRAGQPAGPARQQPQADAQAAQQAQAAAGAGANDIQARWEAAKKGEFAAQYGADVQKAIQERFKNQNDANAALDKLEPMLKVLRERAGVEDNDSLIAHVMDDDSIYEDAANEAGMTVPAYRNFLKYKEEHDQRLAAEQQQQHQEAVRQHYMHLAEQTEQLRSKFPDVNLDVELQNETFLKLTSPAIGLSVEDAYFAVHHKDLAPQMMAYGMQRARNQMAQTIMVNGNRPREGGLNTQNTAAADMKVNPKSMLRKERDALRNRIHAGLKGVTFD